MARFHNVLDRHFWAVFERVWRDSACAGVRERVRRRACVDPADFEEVLFELCAEVLTLGECEGIAFMAIWREKADGLLALERIDDLSLASTLVAMGSAVYDEALRGGWRDADDPSNGAFAAMLLSFHEEVASMPPLARSAGLGSEPPMSGMRPRFG